MSETSDGGPQVRQKAARQRTEVAFPYSDLEAALDVAQKVHEKYGGSCDLDQLAAAMGSSLNSGGFRGKVAAAKLFGLLTPDRGSTEISALGKRAVNDATRQDALADAFLNVPLYKMVYDEYRGSTLPPQQGLEAKIRAFGVPDKQTKHARQVMVRSAEFAGYQRGGADRLVRPPVATGGGEHTESRETEKNPQNRDRDRDNDHDEEMEQHPLITGLWKMLPSPGQPFSEEDRKLWLRAADVNLALLYRGRPALPEDSDDASAGAPSVSLRGVPNGSDT